MNRNPLTRFSATLSPARSGGEGRFMGSADLRNGEGYDSFVFTRIKTSALRPVTHPA
jgi:hypothetical protein